ncbi:L-proline glycine betaine ABC transport system permease protein ProV [Enterococcus mundtii 3F]|uniref:ABC transporter ATP-binding protein n=1 Tax=Enterococcus mundtii TaxID=53346 RepID=UPI002304A54A|nr:ABC transporter ATP-binding protein [Enterococcus mundtii]MDA9461813.1 L-proline glycine betaine ABC transport system permease protein ProV [Enterococcus mundtii 3F]
MTELIEFKNVQKIFNDKYAIRQLDLSINEGEIFVLVGPSGSGKTTSLKMINGLSLPSVGEVYFKGKSLKNYNLQKMRWQMGYVLQQIALFPTMTVKQNIEVIPEMLGWEKQKRSETSDQLLTKVGLDPEVYRDRMPQELSGGEQQRVGIVRALAANPEVILMDEPFSALDPLSRTSLQELVLSLHKELGTTIVFVTHNMEEAIKLGDRIAVMKEGVLIQCDTPERLLMHPENDFVRSFFEESIQDNDQTVEQLILAGFFEKEITEQRAVIQFDAPLKQLFAQLEKDDKVNIYKHEILIGEISRENVFAFLSGKHI